MSRKFEQGRFLIVGDDARKIQSQFAEAKREAVACSTDELVSKLRHQAATAHFETTVWFYPSERGDDEARFAGCAFFRFAQLDKIDKALLYALDVVGVGLPVDLSRSLFGQYRHCPVSAYGTSLSSTSVPPGSRCA